VNVNLEAIDAVVLGIILICVAALLWRRTPAVRPDPYDEEPDDLVVIRDRDALKEPWRPGIDRLYCAACGRECEASGHLMAEFMLCPMCGEFTIAPVVMRHVDGTWWIHFKSEQERAMWHTARELIAQGDLGAANAGYPAESARSARQARRQAPRPPGADA
jgi:hypothetical protein